MKRKSITIDQILFGCYKKENNQFSLVMDSILVDPNLLPMSDSLSNLKGIITDDRKISFRNGNITHFELSFDKDVKSMEQGRFVYYLNEIMLINGSYRIISGRFVYYDEKDKNIINLGNIIYRLGRNRAFA